jgi:hypothetical protein
VTRSGGRGIGTVNGCQWWVDDAHEPPFSNASNASEARRQRIAVFPRHKLVIVLSSEIDLHEPTLRGIGKRADRGLRSCS